MSNNDPSTHLSIFVKLQDPAQREVAWQTFFRRYQPLIVRLCRACIYNPSDVDDCVQEVMTKLFRSIHQYDPERGFRPWLKSVIHSVLADYMRRVKRNANEHALGGSDVQEFLANVAAPDLITEEVLNEAVRDLLRALEPWRKVARERAWDAFVARHVFGKDTTTVAAELGMNVTEVYRAVHEIKKLLSNPLPAQR